MGTLNGKVAVITGSTRGFGLALARAFLTEGASVVISSRSEQAVAGALTGLADAGEQAAGFTCDVTNLASVYSLRKQALEAFGQIDIWVNNAGVSGVSGPTAAIAPDQVSMVLNTNIYGVYHGSLVAVRYFVEHNRGKLINILGQGDRRPQPFANAYSSSKAWVRSFTQGLAKEYAESEVGIFMFNPGLMYTDLMQEVDVVAGYEERLRPLEIIMRMWANDPGVPAQKAVQLAGPATNGKTGLETRQMTPRAMLTGAVREGIRQIFRRPDSANRLNLHSLPPDLDEVPGDDEGTGSNI